MSIRPMQISDLPKVLEIEQDLFPSDAWTEQLFLSELAEVPSSRAVNVIEIADQIIGYASLRFVGREGDVNTIAIAREFQGKGFGKLLLDWMLETAKLNGVKELFLDVRADNQAAIGLYLKEGFDQIDIRRNYYDHKIDALVMRKKLS
jgi:ribosomal-protein-alanine N-acetyltransferase